MWKGPFLIAVLALTVAAAISDQRPQYTQDLEKFRTDKYKIRMEMLVGCWLMTREYLPLGNQQQKVVLIKKCLKYITRKDSVVKITSLIGKNMTQTKTYDQIVPSSQIHLLNTLFQGDLTQFDNYLVEMVKKYELDLVKVQGDEGKQLKKRVQEQVQKRNTQYYFGIIPVNTWTHLLMLVLISLLVVMVFNCFKCFSLRKSEKDQKECDKHQRYFNKTNKFTKDPKGQPKKNL